MRKPEQISMGVMFSNENSQIIVYNSSFFKKYYYYFTRKFTIK